MLNKELFVEDPSVRELPNLGVAKIAAPDSDAEWNTLRFELSHFVCEGAYQTGLDRILGGYLGHVGHDQQPSVWVSGFYGSGKSHFLKVLQHLWIDTALPGNASARGLVTVPDEVKLHLLELDSAAKRNGGAWAAAGTMGAGASGSARLAFLRILFLAADLPPKYPAARLVMWMRQEGIEQRVRDHITEHGKDLQNELNNMYVSPILAEALIGSVPGFADSTQAARGLVKEQYPNVTDITNDELLAVTEEVLRGVSTKPGQLPCTLVVLDELQQYIGTDAERTNAVMEIVQAVQSHFGSLVLFVAAGQSALGSHPQLRWLQDRFTVRVEFQDTDVDQVVRQVILRKKPNHVPVLKAELEKVSGEINRHLQGTKLAPTDDDAKYMVADYPILPTRRRFWEHVLRAIDTGGTSAQLRTQLRTVQEAARKVAGERVGVVVPADFIYSEQAGPMLHSGVLTRDAQDTINEEDGADKLGGRIAALVFLIDQLKQANPDLGVRATPDTIADLLVSDLNAGSASLRRTVEARLDDLVDKGSLTCADGEYSLQTPESAEWVKEYRRRATDLKGGSPRIAAMRSEQLQKALHSHLGNLIVTQGEYKVARKGKLHLGADAPVVTEGFIPVWVRDEWEVSLKAAEQQAIGRGPDDPVVHVLLPKGDSSALDDELVKYAAATDTVEARAIPSTDEGRRARSGIDTIAQGSYARVEEILRGIVSGARVMLSGGHEVTQAAPKAAVEEALRSAAVRMYPRFSGADHLAWASVVKKAPDSGAEALHVMGYDGKAEDQPVCKEVLAYVGAGKRGSDIRAHFGGGVHGWPQDAVDGALLVLTHGNVGVLRAEDQSGVPVKPVQLNQSTLGKYDFKRETVVVAPLVRIELRALFQDAGITCKAGDETAGLARYLQHLIDLAASAGGATPRPPASSVAAVTELQQLSGNDQLVEAHSRKDELGRMRADWKRDGGSIVARMERWDRLDRLCRLAAGLDAVDEARAQMDAIAEQRSLLAEPDATASLLGDAIASVRTAVIQKHDRLAEARRDGVGELESVAEFAAIPVETRQAILRRCKLEPLPPLELGTEEAVLRELESRPLAAWSDLLAGVRRRVEDGRSLMAKEIAPTTVTYVAPARTLKSEADVDAYLGEVRGELMEHIAAGNPVLVSR